MKLTETLVACGESASYIPLNTFFIIYGIATFTLVASFAAYLFIKYKKAINLREATFVFGAVSILSILLIVFFGESAAKKTIKERLALKAECIDAAIYYGADTRSIGLDVLTEYNGSNPKVYNEIITRYSLGILGAEKNPKKASFYKEKKEMHPEEGVQ